MHPKIHTRSQKIINKHSQFVFFHHLATKNTLCSNSNSPSANQVAPDKHEKLANQKKRKAISKNGLSPGDQRSPSI